MATLTSQIEALIAYANETTGKGDTRLGDAVKSLADGYGGGGRLPKEYQEVEYIESTGTQWIDTGIVPTSSMSYYLKSFVKESSAIIGARDYVYGGLQIGYNTIDLFGANGNDSFFFNAINDVTVITIVDNNLEITANDVVKYQHTFLPKNTTNRSLYLFGLNDQGRFSSSRSRIYTLIISSNSAVIINLIPCYRKSDGEVGMYDIVNNVFHTNQGTGTFLRGADVNVNTSITPEFPNIENADLLSSKLTSLISYANSITGKNDKTIGDAVRSLVDGYGSKVKGYTFHSYLEKGTYNAAYIDTGLTMTGFIAKFKCSWRTTNGYFVGSHNSSSPYARQGFYLRGNNQWELGLFETVNQKNYSGVINKVYDIEFSTDPSNGYAIVDGVKLMEGISTTPTEPKCTITLFKMGLWPTLTAGKLFETWIYDLNRNIVAHYLPASRDSDGVCGMYDLVTDTFLTNASSSGGFTVGN